METEVMPQLDWTEANVLDRCIETISSFVGQPFGVSEACLTPAELISMLKEGLTGERLKHVIGCQPCFENVTGVGELNLVSPQGFVARAMAAAGRRTPEEADKVAAGQPLVAFIAVDEPVIRIDDVQTRSIDFQCQVIPGFRISNERGATDITISGALDSKLVEVSTVDVTQDGTPDMLQLRFPDAKLSPTVRIALKENHPVTDTIVIRGSVAGDVKQRFAAQARLRFDRGDRMRHGS